MRAHAHMRVKYTFNRSYVQSFFSIYFHGNLKIRLISYNSDIIIFCIQFQCTSTRELMMFELKFIIWKR